MPKGLIIISDSNPYGISHKLIAPTIKFLYTKRGLDCDVINLHDGGFDPMISPIDSKNNAVTKAYKHYFKMADQIHIITNRHLGGLSAGVEGFFEHVLTSGFSYQYNGSTMKSMIKNKDVYFHIHDPHANNVIFNSTWFRIKFSGISKLFKSTTIFQSDLNWADTTIKNKKIHKLRDSLIKKLFI